MSCVEDVKLCYGCLIVLPMDEFYEQKTAKGTPYLASKCKECWKVGRRRAQKRYTRKHREKVRAVARNAHYKRNYGLTAEAIDRQSQAQNGRCAICDVSAPLVVDHDHATNRVRGLICRTCNSGLGHFKDDIAALRSAILYLETTHET